MKQGSFVCRADTLEVAKTLRQRFKKIVQGKCTLQQLEIEEGLAWAVSASCVSLLPSHLI